MRIAFICEPQVGGTYTYFEVLRLPLLARGIDFRCISPVSGSAFGQGEFAGLPEVDYLEYPPLLPDATGVLIDHLQRERYDAVMVLPGGHMVGANLLPYLPRTIRSFINVPMMTRGAYRATRCQASSCDKIIAVSDRIAQDLASSRKLAMGQVVTIYHGVDDGEFSPPELHVWQPGGTSLRILYIGRLVDSDKGVLLLPGIMKKALAVCPNMQLTVVGSGCDREALERAFARHGVLDRITMVGAVPFRNVRQYYKDADCFILPSRFEGCGFALLEAMASGCAPVASDIRGSVSVIVEQGVSGLLARAGDEKAFAAHLVALASDHDLVTSLRQGARMRVAEHFSIEQMADAHEWLFRDVLSSSDRRTLARSLHDYSVPKELSSSWRALVPQRVKNSIRKRMERMGISV